MPDLLRFDGGVFPGTPEHVQIDAGAVQHRLLHFWGLVGAGLINGERKERLITVQHVLHNGYASKAVLEVEKLNWTANRGDTGELQIVVPSGTDTYPHCLYLGWESFPDPAHGPLPDSAGTLDGGWWQRLLLRFLQLRER